MRRLMKSVRFSIRTKLIVFITVTVAISLTLLTLSFTSVFQSRLRQELFNEARAFSSLATSPIGETYLLFKDSGTIRINDQARTLLGLQPNIASITIVDIDGSVLFHSSEGSFPDFALEDVRKLAPTYVQDGDTLEYVVQPFVEQSGIHRISMLYEVDGSFIEDDIASATRSIVIASTAGLVVLLVLLNLVLDLAFIRPTKRIINNALLINVKNSYQITTNSRDELGELDHVLKDMATRLQRNIIELKELDEAKSEFMVIVTHNLHTPLAIIRDYTEMIQTYDINDKTRESIEVVQSNIRRLQALIEDTIIIASIEADENPMQLRAVELNEFFTSVSKEAQQMAEIKGLTFNSQIGHFEKKVYVSSVYLRSAIWNLIENALKFTKEGEISLRMNHDKKMVRIEVSDTGIGIARDQQEKLFTKFHRGTDLYRYEFDGLGLGLYTTKLIVDGQNGNITIDSIPEEGTTVIIEIPYITEVNQLSLNVRGRVDPFDTA